MKISFNLILLTIHSFVSLTDASNNVSLADNLRLGSNASEITPRQEPQEVYTYGGFEVWFSSDSTRFIERTAKRCTLGFPVKKVRGRNPFDHGFLTLGGCQVNRGGTNGVFRIQPSLLDPNVREIIRLGTSGSTLYHQDSGLNFNIVRLLPNNAQYLFWSDAISASVKIPFGFADVIAQRYIPNAGTPVCFSGSYSSHVCGTVTDPETITTTINPWRWRDYMRNFNLNPTDYFQGLIRVQLDNIPQAWTDGVDYDRGSPVYFPIRDNVGQIIRVQPVGILMEITQEARVNEGACEIRYYAYCVSIDKILDNNQELELIGIPPQ